MEKLLGHQGIEGLLASIVVILCLHLLARLGEFVFKMLSTKNTSFEKALGENTEAVKDLRVQIGVLEHQLIEVHKFKSDSRKLFSALKIMAGKDWPAIRKALEDDELPK